MSEIEPNLNYETPSGPYSKSVRKYEVSVNNRENQTFEHDGGVVRKTLSSQKKDYYNEEKENA